MVYYCSEFAPFTRIQQQHILDLVATHGNVMLLVCNESLADDVLKDYFDVIRDVFGVRVPYRVIGGQADLEELIDVLEAPVYFDGLLQGRLEADVADDLFLPVEEQYGYELLPFVETHIFDDVDERVADYIIAKRLFGITDDMARVYDALSYPRFQHTMRVRYLTGVLAEKHGLAVKDAQFAALFHDYAKERPDDELAYVMRTFFPAYIDAPVPAWHGFVAARLVSELYEPIGQDSDIYQAIAFHTVGVDAYAEIGLALFIADFCDYRRPFAKETHAVWEVAQNDLYRAARDKLLQIRTYFAKKQHKLYRTSEAMLAWLLVEIETRE